MKRYFLINTGRYGGELTVGTVTPEFVEYWKEKVEQDGDSDLISHLQCVEWGDLEGDEFDAESPQMCADYPEILWHECDDLEHLNGPYADNQYSVTEIKLADNVDIVNGELQWTDDLDHHYGDTMYHEVGEYNQHDYANYVYGREAYSGIKDIGDDKFTPVLTFHSSEKGGFGEVIVETNGSDFDPEKLSVGVCETDLAVIVEAYWYDGRELILSFDNADTNGKGYYANVGWLNPEWHDTLDKYALDSDFVKEALEELYFQDVGC